MRRRYNNNNQCYHSIISGNCRIRRFRIFLLLLSFIVASKQMFVVCARSTIQDGPSRSVGHVDDDEDTNNRVQFILAGLTEDEQKSISDPGMPLRHLRAEKGDTEKALREMKETLAWRKEFQVDLLRDCFQLGFSQDDNISPATCDSDAMESCSSSSSSSSSSSTTPSPPSSLAGMAKIFRDILWNESESAKVYVRGYDVEGRAVIYLRPGRNNAHYHDESSNMRLLVWNLEKAIAVSERNGQTKIVSIVDFEGFSLRHAPPMRTIQHTMEVFQKHYPERCHKFYLTHPPFIFKTIWSAVKHFLDPRTRAKIVFCSGKTGQDILDFELGGGRHEAFAGGNGDHSVKLFDRHEYFLLDLDEGFDDASWPTFGKKKMTQQQY